jgi:putrescine transport system substrate-binding protein
VAADATIYLFFPNASRAAFDLVDPEIRADPAIRRTDEVRAQLFPQPVHDARGDRALTRLWTEIMTGR